MTSACSSSRVGADGSRQMIPAASSQRLPARQPIAILDQAQGLEIVLQARSRTGVLSRSDCHEMRDRPVIGALVLGGEIVVLLRRATRPSRSATRPSSRIAPASPRMSSRSTCAARKSVRGKTGEHRDGARRSQPSSWITAPSSPAICRIAAAEFAPPSPAAARAACAACRDDGSALRRPACVVPGA